ncbi:MDR family MFS transporter [Lichenihabitans psoromatis]|uniref:MDR family MFS transporter n=1 Tax=Lichenihabitans psoromatis TaxID=2528642 RepID=UPI001036B1D1|nr:MDR family MFS transporter [Lichenihabitans psoromatis]
MTDSAFPPRPALQPDEIRSIIIGLMMAMLLAALDQTIVATAMPTIGRELGDAENLPWIVTAYLLASTAVTPLYGKFSDIHGRRIALLIAIILFIIGSLACALAPTMVALALARGVQGLGGGGLISLAQTILGDILSPRERARYQVFIASVFALSSLAGPLLGGFFAEHFHWSLIFWINLPIGLAAFLMTNGKLRLLPRHERRHSIDFLGAAILVVATVSLLLALSWGGIRYPWGSPRVLTLLGLSIVAWAGFVVRLRMAREPLIPLAVLGDQVVATGTLAACFAMGTFIGLTIYVPIYLEGVLGLTASQSGIALVPLMIGTVAGATISGRSMMYFTHYKRLPLIGMVISVVTCAVLALAAPALPLAALEVMLLLISLGLGTILPLATIAIQNAVAHHQLGTATATMNFFRSLGGALIVAVFGTIVIGGGGVKAIGIGNSSPLGAADLAQLSRTFQVVFAAADISLILALLWLALMQQRPLRGQAKTSEKAGEPLPIMIE